MTVCVSCARPTSNPSQQKLNGSSGQKSLSQLATPPLVRFSLADLEGPMLGRQRQCPQWLGVARNSTTFIAMSLWSTLFVLWNMRFDERYCNPAINQERDANHQPTYAHIGSAANRNKSQEVNRVIRVADVGTTSRLITPRQPRLSHE